MIGIQLINLMEQVHSVGFVYNDLKPENICVGNFEENKPTKLKLIDFGLATSFRNMVIDNEGVSKIEHIKMGK